MTADRSAPVYETIGVGYADVRRPDPRIAARLHAALGDATPVLNVGAGTGSYEPTDRVLIAVEPSPTMLAQRSPTAGPALQGVAAHLPFADGTFAGAMALLTLHHWPDWWAGLAEVRRVTTGPVVVFTFDYHVHLDQWLVRDYLPGMANLDTHTPSGDEIAQALGGGAVEVLPVPHDCTDGFCHAWWRRPEAYLSPAVRAGISGIARQPKADVDTAMAQLEADLADGTWHRRHADLIERDEIDAGYRIVIAPGPS